MREQVGVKKNQKKIIGKEEEREKGDKVRLYN